MPVTIEPFHEQENVFIYRFIGNWSWDEAYEAVDKYKAMVETIVGRVDNIVDFSESKSIPNGALLHLQAMAKMRPAHAQLAIFITHNRFGHILINVASHLNKTIHEKYKVVSTLKEALDIIIESRAKDI